MTHGICAPRIGFGHVRSTHFAGSWTPRCRHTFFHARQPADHPYYRPLTYHANSLLRLCLGGAGHGWWR
jgi:hypothetical protein